jgi:DNA-binding Lrp family transcriptional regulator
MPIDNSRKEVTMYSVTKSWPEDLVCSDFRILFHLSRRATDGMIPATKAEISRHCRISPRAVKESLERLVAKGLAREKRFSADEALSLIQGKQPAKFPGAGVLRCEWCGGRTITIHSHHFPIRKTDGGKECVEICPGCHAEFHCLTEGAFYEYLGGEANGN